VLLERIVDVVAEDEGDLGGALNYPRGSCDGCDSLQGGNDLVRAGPAAI
jgi:hypothetical protein